MTGAPPTPLRLLVVLPSWVGDAVMATPALALLRDSLPGCFIGGLARPGIDEVLAGSPFLDHVHVDRARGVMGPKRVAAGLRQMRYDTALLLTNSFSTALIARLAWIPRRIGYDRDGRGLLLTDRLSPPRLSGSRELAPVPALDYYLDAARAVAGPVASAAPRPARLRLSTTPAEERAADEILSSAAPPLVPGRAIALINPGGNNPAKRWPAERFARVAAHLADQRGLNVLIAGSPAESALADEVARRAVEPGAAPLPPSLPARPIVSLPSRGLTIGSLKALIRRAAILVTNDTGPRHIGAAFGIPTITLFGPTDPRWTTLPEGTPGADLVADPTLPPDQVADNHPDRCRIDRIPVGRVLEAVEGLLPRHRAESAGAAQSFSGPG